MSDTETGRVALIRFTTRGTQFVGSGLLVNDHAILTADHVAAGFDHQIDCWRRTHEVAEVLRSGSPQVDLAILTLRNPIAGVDSLRCARVDRDRVSQIRHCVAVGFPRWKRDGSVRRSAQVDGTIPTAEGLEQTADQGLRDGYLTLVGNRKPVGPPIRPGPVMEVGNAARWGGMSGAVVTADSSIIGVVRSVNLAADDRSLTVTPLTAIETFPDHALRRKFWDALGVTNPEKLLRLPQAEDGKQGREPARLRRTTPVTGVSALAAAALLGELHGQRHPPETHSHHTTSTAGGAHDGNHSENMAPDDVHHEDDHWTDGDYGSHDSGTF